jgi:hypothetical protein
MRRFIMFLALVIMYSCVNDDSQSIGNVSERTKKALLEVDRYYQSEEALNASQEEITEKIKEISKRFSLDIIAVSYEQYHGIQSKIVSGKMCVCCGEVVHMEVVDEGGGCFGLVRQYANGSASISAYCNNGATFVGYYCYE